MPPTRGFSCLSMILYGIRGLAEPFLESNLDIWRRRLHCSKELYNEMRDERQKLNDLRWSVLKIYDHATDWAGSIIMYWIDIQISLVWNIIMLILLTRYNQLRMAAYWSSYRNDNKLIKWCGLYWWHSRLQTSNLFSRSSVQSISGGSFCILQDIDTNCIQTNKYSCVWLWRK